MVEANRSPGDRELTPCSCPGAENRLPNKKKIFQIPGVMSGGLVTGAIEPCIIEESGETVSNIPDITNFFCILFWG